jgi:ketosteroid isomerase-like protein
MRLARRCVSPVLFYVCVAFVCSPQSVRAGADADRDRQQILQIEREWVQSFETNDVNVPKKIIADDFLGTDIDGKRYTKAELIAEMKPGEAFFEWHRLNEDDVTIRFYGDVGVVNGSESWKRKQDGKSGRYVWTDIFVKRNGTWQVVAAQDIEILDKT